MSKKYDYDVIIIGAGISGLVCGCYLAKAGLKTLIIEKNAKSGGYCTSFNRGEFSFDFFAHSLGSCRVGGQVRSILSDLNLKKLVLLKRYNPSDTIIFPNGKISIWSDFKRTISDFQCKFPSESKNVKKFFKFINDIDLKAFASLRNKTFKELLDKYLFNEELKSIISLPVLGNGGLPASKISAVIGVSIYKEFILDGGYYPAGGMQSFPNALAERFLSSGGNFLFSNFVKKIKVDNKKAVGVLLKNKSFISSKYIISSCDAIQTFYRLIGRRFLSQSFIKKLDSLTPSTSFFILNLGFDTNFKHLLSPGCNTWYSRDYDFEKKYTIDKRNAKKCISWLMIRLMPDNKSALVFTAAPYVNPDYWRHNKHRIAEALLQELRHFIPDLPEHISFKSISTPLTLEKYTMNHEGAAYGWAALPSQVVLPFASGDILVKQFYLIGHWCSLGHGIPGVVRFARQVAKSIIINER